MIILLGEIWLGMAICMTAGWWAQWRGGDGGWTDVFWTFAMGLVGAAAAMAARPGPPDLRQVIIALLLGAYALRLGSHILARVRRGPEDPRYADLRSQWAPNAQKMMFGFLQAQAFAGALLLASVAAAARKSDPALGWRDGAGFLILIMAIAGESVADRQLRAFAADPAHRRQVCETGLWAWSRHPNYFFQWLGWLAYPVIAVDVSGHDLWSWISISAPAYMYYLLRHVSGVPPLEAHMRASRGQAFADYQARVSVFFPRLPKTGAAIPIKEPS